MRQSGLVSLADCQLTEAEYAELQDYLTRISRYTSTRLVTRDAHRTIYNVAVDLSQPAPSAHWFLQQLQRLWLEDEEIRIEDDPQWRGILFFPN